jgi:hypothetical protein
MHFFVSNSKVKRLIRHNFLVENLQEVESELTQFLFVVDDEDAASDVDEDLGVHHLL